jgi:hypothetical protein
MRDTLFRAFLDIFLGGEDSREQATLLPSFANEITLRVKIGAEDEQTETMELKRTKSRVPEVEALLRRYILSTELWDIDVKYSPASKYWNWTRPPGGGVAFCTADLSEEGLKWVGREASVSRFRIEVTIPRTNFAHLNQGV